MKRIRWVAAPAVVVLFVGFLTGCDDTETSSLRTAGPSEYVIQMSVTPNPLRIGDTAQLSLTVFRNGAPFTGGTVNLSASDPGITLGEAQVITDVYGTASTTVDAGDVTSSAITIVAEIEGHTSSSVLSIYQPLIQISLSANPDPLTLGGTAIGTVEVLQDGLKPATIDITVHITDGFIVDFDSPDEELKGILFEGQINGLVTFGIDIPADVTSTFTTFSVTAGGVTQDFIVNIVVP